ncbi:hypothetical protein QX249_24270 [Vibrio parahaemolyticus]|uniref:Uncharacterized protein n=1 Tax=Vibrio parahaemolyticus TaxID=670 RepID=A0AAW8Q659_VIBPH|nr:hypothetical protein [Vibrio parahaemolyticus]EGR2227668.1 hypothetical protein [Vibrio parahaemolyticus]MDS1823764.1 hypothetical protein [Vibrio parahaemolyticus]
MEPIHPAVNFAILLLFLFSQKAVIDYVVKKQPTTATSQWVFSIAVMINATGVGFGIFHAIMNLSSFGKDMVGQLT